MSKLIIESSQAPKPIGPYSQGVMAGNTLYVSGQIPLDASGENIIDGGIEPETRKVMDNIGAILNKAGMHYSQIVKCSIFVTDIQDFSKVNQVYSEYFQNQYPARETIEVAALPKGAGVEISCIAVRQA